MVLWLFAVVLPPDSPWNLYSSLLFATWTNTGNTQLAGQSFKEFGLRDECLGQTTRLFPIIKFLFVPPEGGKSLISSRYFSILNQGEVQSRRTT
jgi:hypothetical protein